MDDRTKAAFDAAGDTIKQLLALATGSIGGTIALFDDDKTAGINLGTSDGVFWGLALFALSTVGGLCALAMLAGQLGEKQIAEPSTYAPPIRWAVGVQMLFYGLAIIVLVLTTIFAPVASL